MCDFLPTDDESLRHWCRHQIRHLPRIGPGLGMKAAEIAVFVEDCRILMEAVDGHSKAAQKHLVRIKKTSLRRQIDHARERADYDEGKAAQLQWAEHGERQAAPVLTGGRATVAAR